MKKLCIVITCLLFLLCGCQEQQHTLDPETPLTLQDPTDWRSFYYGSLTGAACQIELCYEDDASARSASISFDGTVYTIADKRGTRTYKYLIYSPKPGTGKDAYDYAEIFLLSDDLNMTSERYLDALLSSSALSQSLAPTEIVYLDYISFPHAEEYGTVPADITRIMESFSPADSSIVWEKNSYFAVTFNTDAYSTTTNYTIDRYDYEGNLLTTVNTKSFSTVFELEDGRFLLAGETFEDQYALTCFNTDGSVSWQYHYPHTYGYIDTLFQKNNEIYAFGQIRPSGVIASQTDILIYRFSLDGSLIQTKQFRGSSFDTLHHIEEAENGFIILASTSSKDGDFPVPKGDYSMTFTAQISFNLELSNVQPASILDYCTSFTGYYNGLAVYGRDPIFAAQQSDLLPTSVAFYPHGIFDHPQGYVIVRVNYFGYCFFDYCIRSYAPSYKELIITGYDSSGTPLWQTNGGVYMS